MCRGLLALKKAASPHHLLEHIENVPLDLADVFVDFRDRARRLVGVEVAVEVDLVANLADALVLFVGEVRVDPGVRGVGQDFALEVIVDVGAERDVFKILEVVVGFVAGKQDEFLVARMIEMKATEARGFRGAVVQLVPADADGEFGALDGGDFRDDRLGGFVAFGEGVEDGLDDGLFRTCRRPRCAG